MRTTMFASGAVCAGVLIAGPLLAGPDRITYPENFAGEFVLYNMVFNADNKRLRMMYVDKTADAEAKPGEPAPNGTVLVMVDKPARLDTAGLPALDKDGNYIPDGDFTGNVFVMEKQEGWGETLGLDVIRNGDWDYAAFELDGTPLDRPTAGCFTCHANRSERDFTFTYFKNVLDRGQ